MSKKRGKKTWSSLDKWYADLQPRRVDIIGDFGGKQLFLIDGDSLLLYCTTNSRVDFKVGFQLLHAVFSVESFLNNLRTRGCNTHVVFFDNQSELCAPSNTPDEMLYKYRLTRTILIQHLRRYCDKSNTTFVFTFPSIDSDDFKEYLTRYPATFLLCHDGVGASKQHAEAFHYMIHQFICLKHSVALIHGTVFKSSRVLVPMITGAPSIESLEPLEKGASAKSSEASKVPSRSDLDIYTGHSEKELLTVIALHKVSQSPSVEGDFKMMAIAMILHEAIVSNTRLPERSLEAPSPRKEKCTIHKHAAVFLRKFCEEVTDLLELRIADLSTRDLEWDVFDLIDGRLFLSLCTSLSEKTHIPATLIDIIVPQITSVEKLSGIKLLNDLQTFTNPKEPGPQTQPVIPSSDPFTTTLLPFNSDYLDEFLAPVKLQVTGVQEESSESKVFRELSHWHNAKTSVDPKRPQKKPGYFAMKRTQRYMADTLVYSASLTSGTGKLIEPQIIARNQVGTPNASSFSAADSRKGSTNADSKKKHRSGTGKENARAAALATQAKKLERRNVAALQHWRTASQEFSREETLTKRFQKGIKFFQNLSKEDEATIGAEVSLYLCDTLYRAWVKEAARTSTGQALGVASLLFNQIMQTARMPNVTEEIARNLRIIGSAVAIPNIEPSGQKLISRQLGFQPRVSEATTLQKLPVADYAFQLRQCGPFLERSFDSRKDDRVPFEPDAWQRSVLDSIDANESLLVVAPTSSGKTFISFYAMEKILRLDDDGVLVYVAPTKALVSQIAAEIQARFQKTYLHEGKSVWAIHTRDYRVNNPRGCQILVTVPDVLQIMLLGPSNATGNSAWSNRIKRVIFDEVHCIGQDQDGLVWEQLLLMAPCPIIALSATVGNPNEFSEWLRVAQESKGFKFRMITHHVRYSDLRTFQYMAPEKFTFAGLNRPDRFPVPGLDRLVETNRNFRLVHPVAAIAHRFGVDLDNLSLEPRDALALWESMNQRQNKHFPLDASLNPSRVFSTGLPKKSDVLAWSKRLKDVLATWLQDKNSPFDEVCNDLDPQPEQLSTAESDFQAGLESVFALLCDLYKEDALPALLFNYDRVECERTLDMLLNRLETAETAWKETSKEWKQKLSDYQRWIDSQNKRKLPKKSSVKMAKDERMREEADEEISSWASFDPSKPLPNFSFADDTKLLQSEMDDYIKSLACEHLPPRLFAALRRGIAVHHAGMNRRYRQVVEILFRKGYLTAVIATGTLALGINMPCKTVAFIEDSLYMTALNYKQAAGRAGRRGFDLLGNVVFNRINRSRINELVSARLPDLKGHFPLTTTFILRILGLVDATGQSSLSLNMVKSLMTQNRLYLGGAEAGKSIHHHLRFSIEYLQRQHLLSANGKPLNFAGLVGHLYFTENAVFAFHSLLKGGYFHGLCSQISRNPTQTLRTLVLIMSHLFNRIDARTKSKRHQLPPLPKTAEKLLRRHNNETLKIFTTYASTYIDQHLEETPDRHLPLTGIAVGGEKSRMLQLPGDLPPTKLRSPFIALSGYSDKFESIHELCSNIRSGVFLEESAIPYIPIWPVDRTVPLNSYIYDFFKHGDYVAMTRDNLIKKGDIWFLFKDFSLLLATIITSLTNFMQPGDDMDDTELVDIDIGETPDETAMIGKDKRDAVLKPEGVTFDSKPLASRPKGKKQKTLESWEDDSDNDSETDNGKSVGNGGNGNKHDDSSEFESDEDDDDDDEDEETETSEDDDESDKVDEPVSKHHRTRASRTWEDGKGLKDVLKAFTMLKEEFDAKFVKTWA